MTNQSSIRAAQVIFQVLLLLSFLFLCFSCATKQSDAPNLSLATNAIPETVDFIFHVKPILSDRCFKCHGPDKQKVEAGLQLHTKELAFAAIGEAKDHYAIVAGQPDQSAIIERIYSDDPSVMMPPPESNLSLSDQEKETIKRWIAQGAEWKDHWAFEPPVAPAIPKVKQSDWPSNPIDNFILHKLEALSIAPSPEMRKEKLIRKLSFDLRGLPPALEEIDAFLADTSERHYQKIISQYLNTDAFAERMTNEWLDLARYADTHGYQDDLERSMWPWRDWVIHAFKNNMPYDQFVEWQLAGDLLPEASKEQIIATAFNRNHKITQEGGAIPEEYRAEYVTDRTNTFGTAFLGLTFECAKCHDHKYDPISQQAYFELFSYFNNVAEYGIIKEYGQIPEPYIEISKTEVQDILTFINNQDTLDDITLLVMEELETPRATHVLNRGAYDQPTIRVDANVPVFGKTRQQEYPKNRLGLSQWLFSPENPLTARVMVNRIWQQLFGTGLVATPYDFGSQGSLPSHPELLDHLAVKFSAEGWDIRQLITYIVSSSTYKQTNRSRPDLQELDPGNRLLARTSRSRLSAEMLRDHALSISGLLVAEVGGPSVKPYQPEGLWEEVTGGGGGTTAAYVQDDGKSNYRRSLYTFWKRTVPPPNMLLFDSPTRDFCTVKRENTSTPLQALVLLNDPQYLEASKALAIRSLRAKETSTDIIAYMFRLATSRAINEEELSSLLQLYEEELAYFKQEAAAAEAFLQYGSPTGPTDVDEASLAAYSFIANTIMNLDETARKS